MIKRLHHFLFYRHLLWEFLRRDLQARYVGSAMGFFWSVINPLILLGIYTVVFGFIFPNADIKFSGGKPRTLAFAFYIFSGLLPWYAFQEALIRMTTCIVDNGHLIKQMRFPAKVLPAYITLSSIVNQLVGMALFLIVLLLFQWPITIKLLALPLIICLQILFMFGTGLLFATLNTYIRDIAPLVSTGTMILMWGSPMFYIADPLPSPLKAIIYSNPITYLITINHDLFIYGQWPPLWDWGILTGFTLTTLAIGYWSFTRCHREFPDLI